MNEQGIRQDERARCVVRVLSASRLMSAGADFWAGYEAALIDAAAAIQELPDSPLSGVVAPGCQACGFDPCECGEEPYDSADLARDDHDSWTRELHENALVDRARDWTMPEPWSLG